VHHSTRPGQRTDDEHRGESDEEASAGVDHAAEQRSIEQKPDTVSGRAGSEDQTEE
jgi:hypothetical protein